MAQIRTRDAPTLRWSDIPAMRRRHTREQYPRVTREGTPTVSDAVSVVMKKSFVVLQMVSRRLSQIATLTPN